MTLFITFFHIHLTCSFIFWATKKPCIPPDQNIHGAGIWGSSIFMPPSTSFVDLLIFWCSYFPNLQNHENTVNILDGEIHQIPKCRHEPQQFTTGPLCVACLRLQFARRRRVSAPQSFGWKRSMIQRVDIPYTLPETNISTRRKGKIIFNSALVEKLC